MTSHAKLVFCDLRVARHLEATAGRALWRGMPGGDRRLRGAGAWTGLVPGYFGADGGISEPAGV